MRTLLIGLVDALKCGNRNTSPTRKREENRGVLSFIRSLALRTGVLIEGLVLLLAGVEVATAQHNHSLGNPPGKLTVAVGNITAAAGKEIDVPITITGGKNLGALELVLTYDPAILEAKSAERGSLTSNASMEYFVNPPDDKAGANPSGRMGVALASQDAVDGDGQAVVTHFVVKGQAGQKSALRLESVRAFDGNHLDFLVTTTAGEFTVGGGWPWWWIAVAVGAVLLLLMLLKVSRRRPAQSSLPPPQRMPPAMILRCPKCGQPIDRGSAFCNHCGQKLSPT